MCIRDRTHEGCDALVRAVYQHVATLKNVVPDDPDPRFDPVADHVDRSAP